MMEIYQSLKHDPKNGVWGNCHSACLASLLELTEEEVPHFYHNSQPAGTKSGDQCRDEVNEWLAQRNLYEAVFNYTSPLEEVQNYMEVMNPGVYYILGGMSTNNSGHSIICRDGKVVHNPSTADIIAPFPNEWGGPAYYCVSILIPLRPQDVS